MAKSQRIECRVSPGCKERLLELSEIYSTQTKVIEIAIDRLYRDEQMAKERQDQISEENKGGNDG